jgi:7-keto-8-aminopelargonate synthetase-like enzyme
MLNIVYHRLSHAYMRDGVLHVHLLPKRYLHVDCDGLHAEHVQEQKGPVLRKLVTQRGFGQ